ncbi:SnoaL-like protein [Pseudonocardia hierapolitana]|uniref:SnoaL-like protein n=1 Tax=Pseudonocardia hierapolitana TaxID=1128676 RepID=A0A561SPX1_9PSEU|nr:nuclear transport factor 2 family protein [Pseudonocardia hierapolitana]TWF76891.1 SnoaL-like protein [Pseudonocardia hierapolitana]
MADWPSVHQQVVDRFAKGWDRPDPHAWDELLAEDAELVQPLLCSGRGRAVWQEEARRLLRLAPDLRGDVLGWAGHDDVVFIDVRLSATVGGKPLTFRSFDKLLIGPDGCVLRREAFFDPSPVALALLLRPKAWLRAARLLLRR